MLFKKSPEKFWDLISTFYAASLINDEEAYQRKIQKLRDYLSPEAVVLDIGCGTGTQCDDLASSVKQVTGVDISGKLLAIAEKRKAERKLENIEFIQTSLFDERFKSDSFDMIMAFYVLHFFEDIDAFFLRIRELLNSDGLLILETACLGEQNKFLGWIIRIAGHMGFLPLINLLTYKRIENALEIAGFELVEKTQFSKSNPEYTLIMKLSK